MPQFQYLVQRFKPRQTGEQELLLFVAPAAEIRKWAGVPRKAFDYQHGFQRTLNPTRVNDVAEYFLEDAKNISPTSIVIGFTDRVKIEPIEWRDGSNRVQLATLTVELPDFGSQGIDELACQAIEVLEKRLPPATVSAIRADVNAAAAEANKLQEEDAVDESFGIVQDVEIAGTGIEPTTRSYLEDFFAQLLGYSERLVDWPSDESSLREILYSLIKPAIIVDGQHRVFGAASVDESMELAVCAIPESSWAENVFQFVVINQKAKPIKPAFLNSIIATSLSAEEIASVYQRLGASDIDVDRAQLMERINTEADSPFRGMINFDVEGSPGFLQFPGMLRLASDFANVPRSHPILLPEGLWKDPKKGWLPFFYALWRGVRKYFESMDNRLWNRPSEDNPNNLLKIVTLQEVQGLMLDNWADSRVVQFVDPAEVEKQSFAFWGGFPAAFFTDEWKKKGLQTSVGRRIIRDAITETRRNAGRKNWGHRRLGLFSD